MTRTWHEEATSKLRPDRHLVFRAIEPPPQGWHNFTEVLVDNEVVCSFGQKSTFGNWITVGSDYVHRWRDRDSAREDAITMSGARAYDMSGLGRRLTACQIARDLGRINKQIEACQQAVVNSAKRSAERQSAQQQISQLAAERKQLRARYQEYKHKISA